MNLWDRLVNFLRMPVDYYFGSLPAPPPDCRWPMCLASGDLDELCESVAVAFEREGQGADLDSIFAGYYMADMCGCANPPDWSRECND